MISLVAQSTRQPARDSKCVFSVSSNTVRTAPVAASATRTIACLWSRDVETKASCDPSGLHCMSLRLKLSPSIARWKSGGIWKRTTFARVDVDDHAVQHRHVLVAGQRVLPGPQHRVADLRLDEVHVADLALVLLVRGDLLRVGRPQHDGALARRPAGVVGGVAEVLHAVGRERASPAWSPRRAPTRFQSLMNTARLPSGDVTAGGRAGRRARRRPPGRLVRRRRRRRPPPRRSPRTRCPARRTSTGGGRSRTTPTSPSADSWMVWNGSFFGSIVRAGRRRQRGRELRVIERRHARSSPPASRRRTSTPSAVALRYQNRSSGSRFTVTLPPTTSGFTAAARNFSARA